MKRKLLLLLVICVTTLFLVFAFTACNDKNTTPPATGDGLTAPPANEITQTPSHYYGEWIIEKEVTCTEVGIKYHICTDENCNNMEWEAIPATGHDFDNYDFCTLCSKNQQNETLNLEFTINEYKTAYIVTGLGTTTETDIYIPAKYNGIPVTEIKSFAFAKCSSLTSVAIPDSITKIGEYALAYCTSLTCIKVAENNSIYKSIDGNLYSKDGTKLIQYSIGKNNISFTIPNSVTTIGDNAFAVCHSLTNITIPNSVTVIDNYAFNNCTSLTSITIPNSVTIISSYAFNGCSEIESVNILDVTAWCKIKFGNFASNPLYYAHNLFLNNELVTHLTIPNNVTSISKMAFSFCTSLTSISIPNSVTSIGNSAFFSCTSLTSITIPNSVTSIGNSAFSSCTSLTSITIPNSVTSIGDSPFFGCSLLTIYCEPKSKPSSWNMDWNMLFYIVDEDEPIIDPQRYSTCPVVWGYKAEN